MHLTSKDFFELRTVQIPGPRFFVRFPTSPLSPRITRLDGKCPQLDFQQMPSFAMEREPSCRVDRFVTELGSRSCLSHWRKKKLSPIRHGRKMASCREGHADGLQRNRKGSSCIFIVSQLISAFVCLPLLPCQCACPPWPAGSTVYLCAHRPRTPLLTDQCESSSQPATPLPFTIRSNSHPLIRVNILMFPLLFSTCLIPDIHFPSKESSAQ